MSALIDDISRVIASPVSRREAFRLGRRRPGRRGIGFLGLWVGCPWPATVGCRVRRVRPSPVRLNLPLQVRIVLRRDMLRLRSKCGL
jgi:hypothetical protein